MRTTSRATKIAYATAGLLAGGVLAGTMAAQAAGTSGSSSATTSTTAADPHPGDNGADGVPEAQEHHGAGFGGLDLRGTVTAVGSDTVTIKTAVGTTTYTVTGASDIDKSGEASLSDLKAGDAVTFSVDSAKVKQIDRLHAGDEAKDMPQGGAPAAGSSATG